MCRDYVYNIHRRTVVLHEYFGTQEETNLVQFDLCFCCNGHVSVCVKPVLDWLFECILCDWVYGYIYIYIYALCDWLFVCILVIGHL